MDPVVVNGENSNSDREEPTPSTLNSNNSAPPALNSFDSQLPNLNLLNNLHFPLHKPNPILPTASNFFIPHPKDENGVPENLLLNAFLQFAATFQALQQQNHCPIQQVASFTANQQSTDNEIPKIESSTQNETNEEVESMEMREENFLDTDLDGQELPRQIRGPRRQYSDMELNVAIHQIKSGQMGTRRASATYGIPRSTLRNKMNKTRDENLDNRFAPYNLNRSLHAPPLISKQSSEENDRIESPKNLQNISNPPSLVDEYQQMQQSQQNWTQLMKSSNFQFPTDIASILNSVTQNHFTNMLLNNQKPSRGKRGQYRRYEKGQLQSAVEAVRNGMSVHRAGTLFGVPHSTLEYKVKDRSRKGQQLRLEAQLKKEQEEREVEDLKQESDLTEDAQFCPELFDANQPSTSKIHE